MLTLDGSTLEGGGQLVRVALSISAICNIPVRIRNIRAGRGAQSFYKTNHKGRRGEGERVRNGHGSRGASSSSPKTSTRATGGGLKESHLAALNWLARECNAQLEGAEVGSREVVFKPRPNPQNTRRITSNPNESNEPEVIALRNPGSVWLIWQAILPYIVFAMSHHRSGRGVTEPAFRIRLKGGTNVPKSPSSEYMQQVFFPLCERVGLPKVDVNVLRRGWTTGAPEIGEVEISVFNPQPEKDTESSRNKTTAQEDATSTTRSKQSEKNSPDSFRLEPFTLTRPSPFTPTSISTTLVSGSPQTHSLLQSRLHALLRSIPAFSSPDIPIHTHPASTSSSGDERRLYILLTATTREGFILGRDYLGSGRKIGDEADRRRMVEEAVNHVVRDLKREVGRGSCVDEFAEDQLVVFQALASGANRVDSRGSGDAAATREDEEKGKGKFRDGAGVETGSLHTRTVRWVCQEMLGTVFDGVGGCEGDGLRSEDEAVGEIRGGLADLNVKQEDCSNEVDKEKQRLR